MQYAVEMSSGAMMYIRNFINTGSDMGKLMREGGYLDTQTVSISHKLNAFRKR
jgi:hypothetical protein